MVVVVYGLWIAALVIAFGLWSTLMETWVVGSVFLVTLWYDARVGAFALVYSLLWAVLIFGLVQAGVLPYAPVFLDRSLDAQTHPVWAVLVMIPFLTMYIFSFGMAVLILLAKKQQDARLTQAMTMIRRYLPSHLAARIESGEHECEARPRREKLTIFFSDIVGFTSASDELDPEELADLLNEYLSEMAEIAERHGASINQMSGDGIMLLFGAPAYTSDLDHALSAINMGLAMQKRLEELRSGWVKYGLHTPIQARMGINTGYVSVGDFGSDGRKTYTAIGMQANIAARIQAHCEPGQLLISESTWALVKDEMQCEALGAMSLKGVHYPVPIFSVHGRKSRFKQPGKVTPIRTGLEAISAQ